MLGYRYNERCAIFKGDKDLSLYHICPISFSKAFLAAYAIPKIKMLCNLQCMKVRSKLPCQTLLTAQQLEPRFITTKVT